jgi:hypothetical protein
VSTYDPEQSHRERVFEALDSIDTRLADQTGDARAQLWARMYATVLGSVVNTAVAEATGVTADHARRVAVGVANYAVADFDEHYLGGKR